MVGDVGTRFDQIANKGNKGRRRNEGLLGKCITEGLQETF